MKTLLLHVPKFNNYYRPIGDFIWLTYMPMGFLAIADFLKRHGFDVEVIHLAVEWVENRDFNIEELVRDRPGIKAVGMNLHWHNQAYDVIEAARALKKTRPDIFIFLGGFTASFYHREILLDYEAIDAVIRGDGEGPALSLLEKLESDQDLSAVENLTWRNGREIRQNPFTYVGDADSVSSLCYTNFSLLRNAPIYIKYMGIPFFFAKGFSKEKNFRMFTKRLPFMPVPVGRGCPFNCSWCGGSYLPQKEYISCRRGFIYTRPEKVVETVRQGIRAGYGTMHTSHDPEPVDQEYFVDLWQRIRKAGIETNWMFECNGLPSNRFVEEFHKTFPGPESVLAISPEYGNERLRMHNKGPGFSNARFWEKLDYIDRLGVSSEIFFSYGLPGENEELLQKTIDMRKKIMKRYKHVRGVRTMAIEMEPGAPWQLAPEDHGIVTNRLRFRDFYKLHSSTEESAYTSFGYYIPDYFEKPLNDEFPYQDFAARMQNIKCRHFCFIHPNPHKCGRPWQGRLFCALTSKLLKLKPRDLSRPY